MYHIERKPKETLYQSKKHYTQFTPSENAILQQIVYNMKRNNIYITPHAKEHLIINRKLVYDTLADCKIIEFNLTCKPFENSCRVLVRSNKSIIADIEGIERPANVCLVLDICKNKLITSYLNVSDDAHKSINWSRYTDSLDIITIARMMTGGQQNA